MERIHAVAEFFAWRVMRSSVFLVVGKVFRCPQTVGHQSQARRKAMLTDSGVTSGKSKSPGLPWGIDASTVAAKPLRCTSFCSSFLDVGRRIRLPSLPITP